MNVQPRKNNVILRVLEPQTDELGFTGTTTKAGIFIPQNALQSSQNKESIQFGIVVAIGPEFEDVKVGDKVIYNKYSAREFESEGTKLYTINGNEIFAVID